MTVRRLAASATVFLLAACAVNPATGRRELMLVSESQEIAMGRESDPQVVASYGLVDDPELQEYVSEIGQRLAADSERPDLPWTFRVVDDPIVNAFALPGGFIYVTRGILAHFDSEAELAGVLGHEIGHVTARHSASQMSRQQLQQLGVGVGMVFSETFRDYGQLAMAGMQIMNLSYSRDDESESDRLGLRYMTREGYDPEEMIGVFQMLGTVSGGAEGRLPEWQMTHPYPENREVQIREAMAEQGLTQGGAVDRDEYLDMIDGIVVGTNPRQGYFEGSLFLHPDLAFQLAFPDGWKTINQTTAVIGVPPGEDGVVALSVESDADDPEAALQAFLSGEGFSGGAPTRGSSDGVSWVRADFQVTTQDGRIAGEVAFLRYDDLTYRLIGYAPSGSWSQYRSAVSTTIGSFGPVTDPAVLEVEPLRLAVVELAEAMSLNSYVERNPQPVEMDVLARVNRVTPSDVISAGTRIKTVVGTPVGR